ncbi:MAG: YraN family protein [Bacteroidetes bacterium]|nr:YraN family protein [Bacteroidota bacterium]
MSDIDKIGPRGEAIALRYLEQIGYKILARNFRYQKGEIDIIATDGTFLIIVEVKSRSYPNYGAPESSIGPTKTELLALAAGFYQELHDIRLEIRFDVVSIIFRKGKKAELTHIREAFHG